MENLEAKNANFSPEMEKLIQELLQLLTQKRKLINQISSENPLQKGPNNNFLEFIQSLKDIDLPFLDSSTDNLNLFAETERTQRSELKSKFKNVFLIRQYLTLNIDNLKSQLSFEEVQKFQELKQNLDQISEIFNKNFENRSYTNLYQITETEIEMFKNWGKYFENGKPQNPNETWQNYLLSGLLPSSKIILDKILDKNKSDDKAKLPLQTAIKQTKENIRDLRTKITLTDLKLDKKEKFGNITRVEIWIKSAEESIEMLSQILLESQKGQLEEQFRQQAIENLNRIFNIQETPQTEKTDKEDLQTANINSNIPLSSALKKTGQIVDQPKNESQIEQRDYLEGIKSYGELRKLFVYFAKHYPYESKNEDIKIRNPETGGLIAKLSIRCSFPEIMINYENAQTNTDIHSCISFPPLIDLPTEFPTKEEWNEILKDFDGHYLDKYSYSQYPRFFNEIGKDDYGNETRTDLLDDLMEFLQFAYEDDNKQAYQDICNLIKQINSLLVNDNSIFFQETVEKKNRKSQKEKTHQIIVQYYSSPNIQKVIDLIAQFNQKGYDIQIGNRFKEISYYDADENDNYLPTKISKRDNIGDIIVNFNNLLKKIFPDEKQRENIIREITTKQ